MNYKYFLTICVACLALGCHKKDEISKEIFEKKINTNKAIIVTCNKCSCIMDFITTNSTKLPVEVKIFADSTCTKFEENINASQISQSDIDKLYERNYNAFLLKSSNGNLSIKILKTEESNLFNQITTDFFKD